MTTSPEPNHKNNMRGAAWMIVAVVFFSATAIGVKTVGTSLNTFQIVFFRSLFGLIVVVPLLAIEGRKVLKFNRKELHILRVVLAVIGMSAGFYAITNLELAMATSLSFTRPLFMIILAVLFLGETVRWRRGVATAIGFFGVLVMLRPGQIEFEFAFIASLISALATAAAMATIKAMAPTDSPVSIMVSFAIGTAFLTAIPALFFWQTPTALQLGWLIFVGIVSTTGQYCLIRAFFYGEATVMNPIDYLQILIATTAGFFLFSELPSLWTFAGAGVIVAATLYILFREAKVQVDPDEPVIPPLKE